MRPYQVKILCSVSISMRVSEVILRYLSNFLGVREVISNHDTLFSVYFIGLIGVIFRSSQLVMCVF